MGAWDGILGIYFDFSDVCVTFVSELFVMEKYIVSARKYRPSTFDTLVGQQTLAHTLKAAIRSGRLAHAYLFCGPRGVGKTSCARIFAKTINCTNLNENGEACGECESCRAFNEGRSYNIMELDAASNNSVDDIRELTDQVRIPPPVGKYRVYIIDEVHMLSQGAFNAFLKTLEEPPSHAIFILATTEKHKILPTILSRCQIYDFTRIHIPDIVHQLRHIADSEGITAEDAGLNVIAQKADGAMRDALSIFDQVAASSGGNITYKSALESLNVLDYGYYFRLVDAFLKGDVPQSLLIYREIRDHGFDSLVFVNGLAQHIRDLMVANDAQTVKLLEKSDDVAAKYLEQSKACRAQWLYKAMDLLNRCDLDYRITNNKQFIVELTLIKLCQLINPEPTTPDPGLKKITTQATTPTQQAQPAATQSQAAPRAAAPQAATQPKPQATAAATAQPKPQVAAQPNTTQPKASATPRITPSIASTPRISATPSISAAAQQRQQQQAPAQAQAAAPQAANITREQWDKAWQAFIAQNATEKLLTNVMTNSPITRLENTARFTMLVDNSAVLEVINPHLGKVVEYMRNALNCPALTIDVKVNHTAQRVVIKSAQEVIADKMAENPMFKEFVERFKLGIA